MSNAKQSHFNILKKFLPYLWPENDAKSKKRVIFSVLFLLLQKATNAIAPFAYGMAVDSVSATHFTLAILLATVGAYVGARLLQQIFDELKFCIFTRVAQQAVRNLALNAFQHLHSLPLRFHLDRQTGGLSTIIERGVKSIEFLLTFFLFNVVTTILEIAIVCVIFGWLFDWHFSLIALITIALYVAFTIQITEWRIKFRQQMNAADKKAHIRAVDSLLNYETVKYFNAEKAEANRYDAAMRNYEDAAVTSRTTLSLLNIGQGAIISVGMLIIMIMAGIGVTDGKYSVGLFAAVNLYLLQMYLPLNFFGTVYREIRQALIDMEEMFKLLSETNEMQDPPYAKPLRISAGKIEFRQVGFGYGRGNVLQNISFTVQGGQKVAIIGASGAGKSTIARLLYRFYNPLTGAILIDGQDIAQCTQQSVRAVIGVVPQDTVLFNDTLRYNLLYAAPDVDDNEVQKAAELADIDDFIQSLPAQYETAVGERGLKLSGGEKQRVAIARAILKKPAIFLFDEATSSLDSQTESRIQRALAKIAKMRTTLVIAHRLSTVVDADEIIVLGKGGIVERGKHAELIQKGAIYTAMWREQQEQARNV